MIVHRALYRETSIASSGVAVILIILFVLLGLTRLLGKAAVGEQAPDMVLALLGLELLRRIDILLPLAFYVGALMTLGRWHRDNEITVLAACGVGISSLARPLMILALAGALLTAVFSLYVAPLAVDGISQLRHAGAQRQEVSGITPGAFTGIQNNRRVLYAQGVDPEAASLTGVFSSSLGDNGRDILTARRGVEYSDLSSGDRFLLFQEGVRYRGRAGSADYSVLEFGAYALRMLPSGGEPSDAGIGALPTRKLLAARGKSARAEWHWRIAKPISVLVLAIFALVLAYTDTRRGRVANLFLAILIYFIYSNLLGIGKTLLMTARVPPELGLWWVHAGLGMIGLILLIQRDRNRPLLAFFSPGGGR